MSTPTQEFSNLCLPDENPSPSVLAEMSFDQTPLGERKIIVRDIIVSFEPKDLPSEFRPDEYSRITERQGTSQVHTEWTIPDDLKASLMQWCCHDRDGWNFLQKMHGNGGAATRALMFEQKVQRRLKEQFEAYDALANTGSPGTAAQVDAMIFTVSTAIETIVEAVGADIETRTGGQYHAAKILLSTLGKVCQRNEDIPFTRRSGRLSMESAGPSPDSVPTLYQQLIGDADTNFVLDALETVQEKWPNSLATRDAQTTMRVINNLLLENGASQDYLVRFQTLMSN